MGVTRGQAKMILVQEIARLTAEVERWEKVPSDTMVPGIYANTTIARLTAEVERLKTKLAALANSISGTTTITWQPGCKCSAGLPVPCTVLDPFGGSGTTGYIASRNGCRAVMIELNPKYAKLAHDRCG